MKLHQTFHHHIARSAAGNVAAMRDARSRLKHDVESNYTDSPCIWVRGSPRISAGPLPSFIDNVSLEDALHTLPDGAREACIKCVAAWRMGHLDATSLREYLRSVAWQSAALQQCAALTPPGRAGCACGSCSVQSVRDRGVLSLGGTQSEQKREACSQELLSEEEMQSMMGGSGEGLTIGTDRPNVGG